MGTLYFGVPWFLIGLLSLIIPFLLLLTKAKSMRVTSFSTSLFLRSITEKASNVIQWKRLLLLIVRILMLFCLTAAFALPFLNRRGGLFLGKPQKHLIFVLDNSYSMGYTEDGKSLFDTAKEKIVKGLKKNQQGKTWFSFYTFNTELDPKITKVTDPNQMRTALHRTPLSSEGTSYLELLAQLKEKIAVNPEIPTQLFIFSDFSVRETQMKSNLETLLSSWCPSCRTQLVPVQPKNYRNFAVQSLILPPHFFVPNAEEEIRAAYQAYGMAGQEVTLSLMLDHVEVSKQKVLIPESGKGIAVFRQKFPSPGIFPLHVQAQPDALETDNAAYAPVQVHDPVRILLIEDREYPYPFDSPYYYFTQVLESGHSEKARTWIDIMKTPLSRLETVKLDQYDFIAVADVSSLEPKQATQLKYYLKEGGSLLFAPGKNFEARKDLNSKYLTEFLGGMFGELLQAPSPEKPFGFSAVNYSLPLFKVFESGKRGNFNSVRFFKAIPFIPQEKTGFETLLWFEDGKPALLEVKKEKGRLFFWASSLNHAWNDFPKQPVYVPFIFELVKYAALHDKIPQSLKAGARLVFDEKGADLSKPIVLKNPNGETLNIYRNKENTASVKMDSPGFYEWVEYSPQGIEKVWAAANVNAEESKPAYLEIKTLNPEKEKSRRAVPGEGLAARFFIYRPFLEALLLILLIEAWLANRFYKMQIL